MKTTTDWKSLVGHRLIVEPNPQDNRDDAGIKREYTLLEVSKKGELLKFEKSNKKTFWSELGEYVLVEDLS